MSGGFLPLRFALNEDQAFEAVLTDIPLFCVGLMAIGIITFIFAMKRVNSTALYLCTASLLLFIAAILDLGRLFIRGPTQVSSNVDPNVVTGFIVSREVGLGLSYGFLYLFVWKAVAQCPNSEWRKLGRQSQPHSASWARWGFVGAVLKWFTLLLIVLIPLLQIVWRIVDAQRRYGNIYIAESTLEIVASTIFILKICLNVLVSPSTSWWIPFKSYLGLVLGLIITAAMGVGNLITFAFSETVLGRFLRAISVYILLLYNLIKTFQRPTVARAPVDDREAPPAPMEVEKSEDTIVRAGDPKPIPTLRRGPSILTLDRSMPTPLENPRPSLRVSTSSRLSALVNRVEKNEALAEITRTISKTARKSPVTTTAPGRPKRPDLRFDIITPALPSTTGNPESPGEPLMTGISLTYYTMNVGPDALDVSVDQDPSINPREPSVHQSDGLGNANHASQESVIIRSSASPSVSISSFDELMRRQNELDKSIANLRLLSVDSINIRPQTEATLVLDGSSLAGDTMTSAKSRPQSTLRTESLSPHSEFSLSVFPVPPSRPESIAVESRFSKPTVLRKPPQPPVSSFNLVPPTTPIPESPLQNEGAARLTSAGTQYDVTSFIGNLTGDQTTEAAGTHQEGVLHNEIDEEGTKGVPLGDVRALTNPTDTNSSVQNLKPMLLPSVASERKAIPPPNMLPARDASRSFPLVGPRDSSIALRPLLLGTSVTSVPVSLPSSTMVPLGRRASRAARITAHKSQISVPRPNASGILREETPEAYERPRPPPPLVGQSDRPKA